MSFDTFYLENFASLVALARSVSGDPSHAEDLAQDAMTKANQRWSTVSTYEAPDAWVRRVLINMALSRRRRLGREAKALVRLDRPMMDTIPEFADEEVWHALAELPDRQRAAVVLHVLEGWAGDDLANILGCRPSTARTHLQRGREALATRLSHRREQ